MKTNMLNERITQMSNKTYGPISDDEFKKRLIEKIEESDTGTLLEIPGVYEAVSEYFNSDILVEYEYDNEDFLDYDTVYEMFTDGKTIEEMMIGYKNDITALREDWNNYTDSLCKDGQISSYAYENWDGPF